MRSAPLKVYLLALAGTLAGCSQTGGFRANNPSNLKTVASVGDKPLPIVSGEPGASLRTETEDLDRPASSGTRISGRVYDERGKPVPGAKVRLAVGKAAGGKVVSATTDRSGAFTLHGLRPGASYTVIAEYQDDDGSTFGRAQAKASQADIRIALQPRDGDSSAGHTSIRPAKARVEPISNVEPVDDDRSDQDGTGARWNAEDLEPPAADAATILPRNGQRTARVSSEDSQAPVRAGWNLRQSSSKASGSSTVEPDTTDDHASSASRSRATSRAAEESDEDGPNPLPPALDSGNVSRRDSAALSDREPVRVAQGRPRQSRARRAGSSGSSDGRASTAIGLMEKPQERAPRPMPPEIVAGERVITPGSYGPIAVTDPAGGDGRSAPAEKRSRSSGAATEAPETDSRFGADSSNASDSSIGSDSSAAIDSGEAARRPTWRELSLNESRVPVDESIQRASGAGPAKVDGTVTLTSAKRPAKLSLARYLKGAQGAVDDVASESMCRIDPTERRIIDFKLPDMTGKMVSLHDFDADVIVLDFWGSWCAPCRTSIAHLIELQAKEPGKRFQVVGIACEKAPAFADRRASAAKAIKEMGITYPVLLSTMDGPCPVQQALQIQFYPTMVLIDREGRLLAREQGATETTLQRMDRAVDSAFRHQVGG
jgi:thiol-disulfide isomerase/thioredoxin